MGRIEGCDETNPITTFHSQRVLRPTVVGVVVGLQKKYVYRSSNRSAAVGLRCSAYGLQSSRSTAVGLRRSACTVVVLHSTKKNQDAFFLEAVNESGLDPI